MVHGYLLVTVDLLTSLVKTFRFDSLQNYLFFTVQPRVFSIQRDVGEACQLSIYHMLSWHARNVIKYLKNQTKPDFTRNGRGFFVEFTNKNIGICLLQYIQILNIYFFYFIYFIY